MNTSSDASPTVMPFVGSGRPRLPQQFLNCYEILNLDVMSWDVAVYRLTKLNRQQEHKDRGSLRSVIWDLYREFKSQCRGIAFVIDLDSERVAVGRGWQLPTGVERQGYRIEREREFTAKGNDPSSTPIVAGLLREGIARHFKENAVDAFGEVWRDYDRYCLVPDVNGPGEFAFCRKFGVAAKRLRGGKWALEVQLSTAAVLARPFSEYYVRGEVGAIAEMVDAKMNHTNRKNRAAKVRVWRRWNTAGSTSVEVLELVNPERFAKDTSISSAEKRELAMGTMLCERFQKGQIDVPMSELHLIVDTQMTGEDHRETILEPGDRYDWAEQVRNFVHDSNVFGFSLELAAAPLETERFPTLAVAPPAIYVRGRDLKPYKLTAPSQVTADALRERARRRARMIVENGFLENRAINPLVAAPERFGRDSAERLRRDFNSILERQGITFRFQELCMYRNAREIKAHVEREGCDALLAVLPESSRAPQQSNDTHEQIKQLIEVPSQCLHSDHTLKKHWVQETAETIQRQDSRHWRRVQQTYEICLLNLLVKHHWVPFAPADPFSYNVHIGLDVGGKLNNRIMACLGYGFSRPSDGLLFLPHEVPMTQGQAEPILPKVLKHGLLAMCEKMHHELEEAGQTPDWERVLFFRDGPFLGAGDDWNEIEALKMLHSEFKERNWISSNSVWTAVEIHKAAEGWRLFGSTDGMHAGNPLVGSCVFPFDDDTEGLLCTTGAPYLTQGTAAPIKFRIQEIHGAFTREKVVREIVWEADMCFTKIDMGGSLPWILHLADNGALQLSRAYKIGGLTA